MKVYADNAATTPMSKAALDATCGCMQAVYGNPSSIHEVGNEAAATLERARETVAGLLGAQPREVYFTSGGTEADNWAVAIALAAGRRKGKNHIVTTAFEHHAILHTVQKAEREGCEVTYLDVHEDGVVRPEEVAAAIREDTALVTVMFANNEIGTLQPVAEIGAICKERGVLFHTDAVQAVGHVAIDVKAMNIDMLSLAAHKFHGPKGVGALYCRTGIPVVNFIEGGAQERGKRGGTENVPGIVGLAAAMQEVCANMEVNNRKVAALRDQLIAALSQISFSRLNGSRDKRLPGIVNFCFQGIEGEALLLMLDMAGISASSGSACTSGSLDPSHVLLALGLPHEIAHGSLRLSLSEYNTAEEVEYITAQLPPIIERLRDMSPVWERMMKGEA